MVLTNDLHRLVFRFPEGIANADQVYEYGVTYYVILATQVILYITALCVIMFKCCVKSCRRKIWIVVLFSTLVFIGKILEFIGATPSVNGIRI